MKILHSAPIDIQISQSLKYAGIERVIDYLNKGLVSLGQDSLVAAPGNSDLGGFGTLVPTREKHLWSSDGSKRQIVRSEDAYEDHYAKALDFSSENSVDVLHDHPGNYIFSSRAYDNRKNDLDFPVLVTAHNPIFSQYGERDEGLKSKFDILKNLQNEGVPLYFNTISKHLKEEYESIGVRVDGHVYNGLDTDLFNFNPNKGDYLFWMGRLSSIKGTDLAARVAKESNRPLVIAGEIHGVYENFVNENVSPYVDRDLSNESEEVKESFLEQISKKGFSFEDGEVTFFGSVDDRQKSILFGNAYATLQPNRWKEPFGLVPVESMATGTPALVTNNGALPELVNEGKTGYVIDSYKKGNLDENKIVEGMKSGLDNLDKIDPYECRSHVDRKFSKERMANDYLELYKSIV